MEPLQSGPCNVGSPPTPAGSPTFFGESRRKEHQGGRVSSSLDPPFLVEGALRGDSFFFAWPAAHEPTPVTARPPAGRAGGGGCCSREGRTHPQSLPLGEGGPAKPGRMRGRPIGPTGGRRKAVGRQVPPSTRKGWVQDRPLISHLRCQLPPRGSLRRGYASATKSFLAQPRSAKCESKSGHVHGHRNSPSIAPAAPHHAKTSEWERAGPKIGGRGGIPRDSLRPGFLLESLDPRPGPGGEPIAGLDLRRS